MEQFLGKKYALSHNENFQDYLQYIGVPYIGRKLVMTLRQMQTLTRNEDGTYLFNMNYTMFSWDNKFTPGVEFDEKNPERTPIRALITLENNVMTYLQKHPDGRQSKHVLEFYPDKKIVTTSIDGLDKIVKRYYKVVE